MRNFLSSVSVPASGAPGDKASQLIDRLSSAMALGLLRTGDRLPSEARLAEILQVSVPTLREALAELRDDGVIETRRGRHGGSFLVESPLDWAQRGARLLGSYHVSDLRDLSDEAKALLGTAAELACQRASDADIRRLRDLVQRARQSTTEDQEDIYNSRFHIELAVVSQSMYLTQAVVQMQARLAPLMRARSSVPGRSDWVNNQHEAIVDAIQAGAGKRAAALAEDHIVSGIQSVIDLKLADYSTEAEACDPEEALDELRAPFERVMKDLQAEATQLRGFGHRRAEGRSVVPQVFALASRMLENSILAGAGALFDSPPDPEARECIYWWAHGDSSIPERLPMDTVAGTDKFYDFRAQPWFYRAKEDREPVLHGPYIDYLGYDDYILTAVAPLIDDGSFAGVVGGDLDLDRVEEVVIPVLRRIRCAEALLVSDTGRVIVGSGPELTSGMTVNPQDDWSVHPLQPQDPGSVPLPLRLLTRG